MSHINDITAQLHSRCLRWQVIKREIEVTLSIAERAVNYQIHVITSTISGPFELFSSRIAGTHNADSRRIFALCIHVRVCFDKDIIIELKHH